MLLRNYALSIVFFAITIIVPTKEVGSVPFEEGERVRKPAVAGAFYPASAKEIDKQIRGFLARVHEEPPRGRIMALVCPHAGYIYSGQVAAYAYKLLVGKNIRKVIVISPSHVEFFSFASVFGGTAYETPLGRIQVDKELGRRISSRSEFIKISDKGHLQESLTRSEHALEVQLPFLQEVLEVFCIVPIVMGDRSWEICEALGNAIAPFLGDPETIIVASSDLSHFHPDREARRLDEAFCESLSKMDARGIYKGIQSHSFEACGAGPIMAALIAAKEAGANSCTILNTTNSGDVTGDKSSVVGYVSAAITSANGRNNLIAENEEKGSKFGLSEKERSYLLSLARNAIAEELGLKSTALKELDTPNLRSNSGAFVTIKINGKLRGCIGYIEAIKPLKPTIIEMAKAAAFGDPRFPALERNEFARISLEISVLSPILPVTNPEKINVGRDGLIIERGMNRGLLLPQVATEYNWDREEFLAHTCRKAMLPPDAWKESGTRIYRFTAEVFGEEEKTH